MIKVDCTQAKLVKAFGLDNDETIFKMLNFFYGMTDKILNGNLSFAWAIQRVWIDETLSDNEKAYLIFGLGRWYENKIMGEGGKDHD